MTVRKLRAAQRGPWCSYCGPKETRAVYRGCHFEKFACQDHLDNLNKDDAEQTRRDKLYSEADHSIPWV